MNEAFVMVHGQPTALAVSARHKLAVLKAQKLVRQLAPVNPAMAQGILIALTLLSARGLAVLYESEHQN